MYRFHKKELTSVNLRKFCEIRPWTWQKALLPLPAVAVVEWVRHALGPHREGLPCRSTSPKE